MIPPWNIRAHGISRQCESYQPPLPVDVSFDKPERNLRSASLLKEPPASPQKHACRLDCMTICVGLAFVTRIQLQMSSPALSFPKSTPQSSVDHLVLDLRMKASLQIDFQSINEQSPPPTSPSSFRPRPLRRPGISSMISGVDPGSKTPPWHF